MNELINFLGDLPIGTEVKIKLNEHAAKGNVIVTLRKTYLDKVADQVSSNFNTEGTNWKNALSHLKKEFKTLIGQKWNN